MAAAPASPDAALLALLISEGLEALAPGLVSTGITSVRALQQTPRKALQEMFPNKPVHARKLAEAAELAKEQDEAATTTKTAPGRVAVPRNLSSRAKVEAATLAGLMALDEKQKSLMEIAKGPRVMAAAFLARATSHPWELAQVETVEWPKGGTRKTSLSAAPDGGGEEAGPSSLRSRFPFMRAQKGTQVGAAGSGVAAKEDASANDESDDELNDLETAAVEAAISAATKDSHQVLSAAKEAECASNNPFSAQWHGFSLLECASGSGGGDGLCLAMQFQNYATSLLVRAVKLDPDGVPVKGMLWKLMPDGSIQNKTTGLVLKIAAPGHGRLSGAVLCEARSFSPAAEGHEGGPGDLDAACQWTLTVSGKLVNAATGGLLAVKDPKFADSEVVVIAPKLSNRRNSRDAISSSSGGGSTGAMQWSFKAYAGEPKNPRYSVNPAFADLLLSASEKARGAAAIAAAEAARRAMAAAMATGGDEEVAMSTAPLPAATQPLAVSPAAESSGGKVTATSARGGSVRGMYLSSLVARPQASLDEDGFAAPSEPSTDASGHGVSSGSHFAGLVTFDLGHLNRALHLPQHHFHNQLSFAGKLFLGGDGGDRKKGAVVVERNVTPAHHFFRNCCDLDGETVRALTKLDDSLLARETSLNRMPVHHYFEANRRILDDAVLAIRNAAPVAFTRKTASKGGVTPIDLYFKFNHGTNDVSDGVVRLLMSPACAEWGVDTIAKADYAFRRDLAKSGSPHKVLLDCDSYELESFVNHEMQCVDPLAAQTNLKYLLGAFIPLRNPSKYGLSATQGLQLITKLLDHTADQYVAERGPDMYEKRKCWIGAFADVAMGLIQDPELLKGLLAEAPSKRSIEAVASTAFIGVILQYKFLAGPVLVFAGECFLFMVFFAMVLYQTLADAPTLVVVVLSIVIISYFTVREIAQMWLTRSHEMSIYHHKNDQHDNINNFNSVERRPSLDEEEMYLGSGSAAAVKWKTKAKLPPKGDVAAPAEKKDGDGATHVKSFSEVVASGVELQATVGEEVNIEEETQIEVNAKEQVGEKVPSSDYRLSTLAAGGGKALVGGSAVDATDTKSHIEGMLEAFTRENVSEFITVYLGMSVSWRADPFNWVDLGTIVSSWLTLAGLLSEAIQNLADDQTIYDDQETAMQDINTAKIVLYVVCNCFCWIKLLGLLRGISKRMATFVLMIREISGNIDAFLIVFGLIILMFATLYHMLLKSEGSDAVVEDWRSFPTSFWKVLLYSIGGDLDDTAFPTPASHMLFLGLVLTSIIVMMNILIAIVSDSYADAMHRSGPLFWRARLGLIAELEPLLPKYEEDDFRAMMDKETKLLYEHTKVQPPQTYQYRMLKFQEGMVATALVCGIVLFELLYISELPNETEFSTNFFAGLAVSGFFLLEILLRFYNWWHTFLSSSASEAYTSGAKARKSPLLFFKSPFRFMDAILVLIDVSILILTLILAGNSSNAKAAVKFARIVRFARTARWLRGIKMLRSCRFVAKLANRWRRYAQPTRANLSRAIAKAFDKLDEANGLRSKDTAKKVKGDLERATFTILEQMAAMQAAAKAEQAALLLKLDVQAARHAAAAAATDARIARLEPALSAHFKVPTGEEAANQPLVGSQAGPEHPPKPPSSGEFANAAFAAATKAATAANFDASPLRRDNSGGSGQSRKWGRPPRSRNSPRE